MSNPTISTITLDDGTVYSLKDSDVRDYFNSLTYTISIEDNVITITGSKGDTSSITLPLYDGGVV